MEKNNVVTNPYYTYGVLYESVNFKEWEKDKGEKYLIYRQDWSGRLEEFDHGDFPLNLNVEVTTRCNLACTFCTHPSLDEDQMIDLPIDIYKNVIKEGKNLGLAAVNLNGLGEPLLRKDLVEFIDFAKKNGVVDIMFHTNGTVMNEKLANQIIAAGIDKVIFSVDSPNKTTYESMRLLRTSFLKHKKGLTDNIKGTKWEKTVDNVKLLSKIRNSSGNRYPIIRATMVITDSTVTQMDKYMSLWKDVVDLITVQDLTWRTKLLDDDVWKNKEETALPTNFDEIREFAIKKGQSFVCPYLFQSTYIHSDGLAIPCSNPNARKHMVMGDFNKQSAKEIWNGKKYNELRDLHKKGKWHEHPVCRDCEVALVELYKVQRSDMKKSKMSPHVGSDWQIENIDQ
jgi:MoaA/NifB/PqqE/SkfB family radical SAM enzyme